jgi:hypothetical protein
MGSTMGGQTLPTIFINKSSAKTFEEENVDDALNDAAVDQAAIPDATRLTLDQSGGLPDAYQTQTKTSYICLRIMRNYLRILRGWLDENGITGTFILIMDGHASHMVPILLDLAISLNIVLYILPPHSSQCTQPMDGLPNQQTSSKFCELVSLKTRQNAGLKLKTNQLIEIFGQAIAFGNSSNNVRQAWKTCGYYDANFNPTYYERYINAALADVAGPIPPGERIATAATAIIDNVVTMVEATTVQILAQCRKRKKKAPEFALTGNITSPENIEVIKNIKAQAEEAAAEKNRIVAMEERMKEIKFRLNEFKKTVSKNCKKMKLDHLNEIAGIHTAEELRVAKERQKSENAERLAFNKRRIAELQLEEDAAIVAANFDQDNDSDDEND